MPSYPQRAGYPNHIIKNTLPSSQSLWDIYAITAVVFLKDRQVAMCPLVSILSRGTLLEKSNSLICPSLWESEHQTPHRDLQRTLKEDLLNLSAMLYVGPQSLSLWVTVDPPITVILFERINQRKKNPNSDYYILWAFPSKFKWNQPLSSLYVASSYKLCLIVSSSALLGNTLETNTVSDRFPIIID